MVQPWQMDSLQKTHSFLLIVVDLYEVLPVSCESDVETFDTIVDVDFEFESEDGVISQDAVDALVQSFLLSYNSLQDRYCDPFFREVAAAEVVNQTIVPTRRHRSLQTRKPRSIVIKVKISFVGTCRGCGTRTRLFVVRCLCVRASFDTCCLVCLLTCFVLHSERCREAKAQTSRPEHVSKRKDFY